MTWVRLESDAYWLLFLASFVAVGLWESFRPKRNLISPTKRRWSRHGVLFIVANMVSVGLWRASPVIMALAVAQSRLGLFNQLQLSFLIRFICGLLLLDLTRYAVHWSYHHVGFLWRVHHVHHSDLELDLSTAVRAHPIEVALTHGTNLVFIALLGVPPAAVLAGELLSCAQGFVSHANASVPGWLEKPLRRIFVTPDMHRIHHSEEIWEQSKNFGDVFPWWDHIFRTYLSTPGAGQDHMTVGLKGYQNEGSLNLAFMLLHPFRPERETRSSPVAPRPD
jgi:sterol desaturase/sphingolipid hydroxylase (fatty acid hydroxylase superfamily)